MTNGNLMQVGNDLIVWAELKLADQMTGASVYPQPNPTSITIQLGGFYNVSEYDPTTGTASTSTTDDVSSITVGVAASPIILQLTPYAGSDAGSIAGVSTATPIIGVSLGDTSLQHDSSW